MGKFIIILMAQKFDGTMLTKSIWRYKITEAQEINRAAGFSDHLNQMGKEGQELVKVETFKAIGANVFYWKRQ